MTEFFASGGVIMWPILAVGLGVVWISGRTALRLRGRNPSPDGAGPDEVRRGLQAILFWGVMAVVLGLLGTTVGIVIMTRAVALAGAAEAPLIWGGIGVALVTLAFGLLVFLLSATLWFVLHQWQGRVEAGAVG